MATFNNEVVSTIFDHEVGGHPNGGLVDHPADPGGITKWGISLNFVKNIWPLVEAFGVRMSFPVVPTPEFIRELTRKQAVEFYQKCWWDFFRLGDVASQTVAMKLIDMAINMGPPSAKSAGAGRAWILTQRALNALGEHVYESGLLGPHEVGLINKQNPDAALRELCRQQAKFYQDLVDASPAKGVFLKGWLKRSAWPFAEVP